VFLFFDFEELDIEYKHPAWTTAARVFPVGEAGWDPEAAFFALYHQLDAFGPAFDDLV
jgi:hypothetical protein